MKTQHKFARALTAAFATAVIGTGAWAAAPTECGLIGTWMGVEANDMAWLGVHTAASTNTRGTMLMDWVYVNPTLLSGAERLTGGRGVWEQTVKGQYKYTWYAYGILEGLPYYSVRVSGTASNVDCDNVLIGYTYEIFFPSVNPSDMDNEGVDPVETKYGSATETRVPLTIPPPPPQ